MSGVARRLGVVREWFTPTRGLRLSGGKLEARLNRLAFNWSVRSALYRHMAVQVGNNIGQIAALETFIRRLTRQKRKSCVSVVEDVVRRMKDGAQLSVALRRWVPTDEALTIAGGENAGRIDQAFDLLVESKARIASVRRTMMAAFATPLVYLFAIYGMLWAIGTYFIPSIAKTVPADAVHGAGALLYDLGDFATSPWMLLPVIGLVGLAGWIAWALPTWTARHRVIAERFFPFNFYRDIQGYVWLLTFASMLRAGMSDTRILEDQARYATPWLRQRLISIRRKMLNGLGLAESLVSAGFAFPNPDLIDDIGSMSDFDDFPERIMRRAIQWADELEWTTKARVRAVGFGFDIVMYALMLLVLVGVNSLSIQLGNVPGLS